MIYSLRHIKSKFDGSTAAILFTFMIAQICTIIMDSAGFAASAVITFLFMTAQIAIFMIINRRMEIGGQSLDRFCKLMILIAVAMCVYNMIAHWDRFRIVFDLSFGAYGQECRSFLYSNHEFAVYLSIALISAIYLTLSRKMKLRYFIPVFAVMILNLLSTYSRTAMVGFAVSAVLLLFFESKNKTRFIFFTLIVVVAAALALQNNEINDFVMQKVFKGSFASSGSIMDSKRENMYVNEYAVFRESDLLRQIFGYGYSGANAFPGHDAYIHILLTGGLAMFAFFAGIIVFSINQSVIVMRYDRRAGALLLGFQAFALLYMVAQTPILFYSTMDSFFITMICVIIPMYVRNYFAGVPGDAPREPETA